MSTCISYVGRSLLLVLSSLTFACGAPDADGGHQVSGVFESPGLRPLGGSSSSTIASAVQPWSIVTDATHAYFLSRHEGNVGRVVKVPLAGGAKVKLAEFNSARLNSLVRISTTLYFTSLSGRVHQMSVAGGHVSIIYDAMSNAYWPRGLAGSGSAFSEPQFFLSTFGDELVRLDSENGGWTATQVTQNGSAFEPEYSLWSPNNIALTSDSAFFTTSYPHVWRVAREGGEAVVVSAIASDFSLIVTDGERIYYSTGTHLVSQPVDGGHAASLVAVPEDPSGLVVRSGVLYWSCAEAGTVNKLALNSVSSPVVIAEGENQPRAVHVDATHVYWGTLANLRRAPK